MKRVFFALWAVLSATALSQTPKAELSSLAWLAGCWEGSYSNGRSVTEQWMKPSGETMMGMSRTVKNGKTVEFEFVRIVKEEDGSIHYVAKPSGQEGASFKLISLEETKVVFENPKHDFPQRISYRLSGDSLNARIEGTMNGKERGIDFPYRKVKCE